MAGAGERGVRWPLPLPPPHCGGEGVAGKH